MSFIYPDKDFKKACLFKILIFLFPFIGINPNITFCQPHPYRFNYLTVDVGLSHTDANDIAQDKLGYMWIGTNFGIDRYDGYNIKKFYNSNEPLNNSYNNRIVCLYPGANGEIWLGTEGGLQCFDSKTEKYTNYKISGPEKHPNFSKLFKCADNSLYALANGHIALYSIKNNIAEAQKSGVPAGVYFTDFEPDNSGNLYLASNKGIWMLNLKAGIKTLIQCGFTELNISGIFIDSKKNILASCGKQLFLMRSDTHSTATGKLVIARQFIWHDAINNIKQDAKLNYWVDAGPSLLCLDSSLNLVQEITNNSSSNNLNSSSISKIYIDRSQCLWVCTFGGGVNYCDLNEKKFYTFRHNPEVTNSISGSYIRSVLDDAGKKLWIGTNYNGLNLYDQQSKKFSFYNTYSSEVKLKSDDITALSLDNDHNLWVGSTSGIEILKANGKELWKPPGFEKLPHYSIDALTKDCYGNMWFGNHGDRYGVAWKDEKGILQVKYYKYGEGYFIFADKKKPELFISGTHGLTRILIDNKGNITKLYHYEAADKPNLLSSDYTYPVCKQNDSTYWIGTIGGGLNRLILKKDNSYTIKSYTGNAGIFNDVESLEIDNSGNIWMGGNGLLCLNPATGKLVRYDKNDGLQGNSFKVGSSYKGADGRLYFGGINGLNYFNPAEIKPNMVAARPILTDLLINNQKPAYGRSDSTGNTLSQIISYSKKLSLNYLQNNFVLSFSAMHYANPLKCRYRYKLAGFDKDWKYTDGKNPTAAYSNLDYSNYKFIVQATNNDGTWSGNQATLAVTITPPWWKSVLAKIIYVAMFIAGLLWIYFYQARWYRLKRELAIRAVNENKREEMHKQREELYQQQLQFFTNISHEFRTPLTLILGPLENLMSTSEGSVNNNAYRLMLRNVKRLINLINELMNFKKIADSAIQLQVKPLAINQFCKRLYLP
jgi:ligand-binding sensor domain-containing protein